jgi:sporulation protein YlmC with PRC-barrel domain
MKKRTQIAFWGTVASLSLAAVPSMAQSTNSPIGNSLGDVERISQVDNKTVMSSDNQKVGKLNNFMLDLESGRILYAVIGGTSKGRIAVAPEIFAGSPLGGDKTLHLTVDKSKVDNAPQFTGDVDKPEGWGQASFVSKVHQYFGQNAWWQGSKPANEGTFNNVHKGGQLIGMKVENVNNATVGKVNDVVVNPQQGRILYVVLQPSSNLNLGDNLYALPPDAITWNRSQNSLVSNIDQQKLASAPHFASNNWPNLSDTSFASQVYQYYGKQPYFQGGNYQPTGR